VDSKVKDISLDAVSSQNTPTLLLFRVSRFTQKLVPPYLNELPNDTLVFSRVA
jgi:hypothetical protein